MFFLHCDKPSIHGLNQRDKTAASVIHGRRLIEINPVSNVMLHRCMFRGKNQENSDALELLGQRKLYDVRININPTFNEKYQLFSEAYLKFLAIALKKLQKLAMTNAMYIYIYIYIYIYSA
jgi:hypothetical protein